jgi:putative SOS response-associated peptidase YedK
MGWYEWQELPTGNLPWYLHGARDELLAIAGLWDRWEGGGNVIESCSIIVGPANEAFGKIHDRMPFALPPDRAEQWLDRTQTDASKAMALLQPNPDDSIAFHRVHTGVSNARNQGANLIEAI